MLVPSCTHTRAGIIPALVRRPETIRKLFPGPRQRSESPVNSAPGRPGVHITSMCSVRAESAFSLTGSITALRSIIPDL